MNDMAKNLILWMIIAGVLLTVFQNINQETREDNINYSEFVREVRSGRVAAVELAGINITGWRSDNSQFRTIMPLIGDNQLMDDLFENGVEIRANEPEQQSIWTQLLVASFPILIIIALFFFFMRQMQGGAGGGRGGPMSFGKSKAKLLGEDQIKITWGVDLSASSISNITNQVLEFVKEWQNRPLETVYAIVYFDAIHYKIRSNGLIESKAAYTCLGIDLEGKKDILGIWIGESESSKFFE